MTESERRTIEGIAALMRDADSVLFITGAGLSATTGIPTFRGVSGLYEVSDNEDGYPIEVSFSAQMLDLRPEIAWKHIARAEAACRDAVPSRAHQVIAAMDKRVSRTWVFTHGIDGLHRAAGSRNLLELNGNLRDLVCISCGDWYTVESYSGISIPPRCGRCGGTIRPEIVLFGEFASTRIMDRIEDEMDRGFDLIALVGNAQVIPELESLVEEAADMGVHVLDIRGSAGPRRDYTHYQIDSDICATLDAIWNAL